MKTGFKANRKIDYHTKWVPETILFPLITENFLDYFLNKILKGKKKATKTLYGYTASIDDYNESISMVGNGFDLFINFDIDIQSAKDNKDRMGVRSVHVEYIRDYHFGRETVTLRMNNATMEMWGFSMKKGKNPYFKMEKELGFELDKDHVCRAISDKKLLDKLRVLAGRSNTYGEKIKKMMEEIKQNMEE